MQMFSTVVLDNFFFIKVYYSSPLTDETTIFFQKQNIGAHLVQANLKKIYNKKSILVH